MCCQARKRKQIISNTFEFEKNDQRSFSFKFKCIAYLLPLLRVQFTKIMQSLSTLLLIKKMKIFVFDQQVIFLLAKPRKMKQMRSNTFEFERK